MTKGTGNKHGTDGKYRAQRKLHCGRTGDYREKASLRKYNCVGVLLKMRKTD